MIRSTSIIKNKNVKFPLDLDHFISRSRVLSLYRKAIRGTRGIPFYEARYETLKWIRDDIERHKWEVDKDKINYFIQIAHKDVKTTLPNYDLSQGPFPKFWRIKN